MLTQGAPRYILVTIAFINVLIPPAPKLTACVVQTFVCVDESADESAIVVCSYLKSATKGALEVPDCLGVLLQEARCLRLVDAWWS